ncbi:MAG: hypothetical protein ACYTGN_14595 [Planctomycetota bacterium]|jgi:hypothetical protein
MSSTSADRRPLKVLALLLGGLLLVTCGTALKGRQFWHDKWGPLVPHKSFPADCKLCHVADRWDQVRDDFTFDHEKETGHALKGAHELAACLRCHNDFGPVEAYAARGCAGCHLDPHRSQLGNDCLRCHTESSWHAGGLVAEHARTRFPLIGRHLAVACVLCHPRAPTGEFRGTPIRCEQCHTADLARATSPDHTGNGWTTRCERCHQPTTWSGGGFSHQFFPLTGAHAVIACNACHIGNVFGPLPRDCLSCHQDDQARAPNHDVFPRNCEQCHNTSAWEGAPFNHRFRIQGPHNVACNTCHTSPNVVNCLSCHDHNRTDMDDEHSEVDGYTYASSACIQCHPTGED